MENFWLLFCNRNKNSGIILKLQPSLNPKEHPVSICRWGVVKKCVLGKDFKTQKLRDRKEISKGDI